MSPSFSSLAPSHVVWRYAPGRKPLTTAGGTGFSIFLIVLTIVLTLFLAIVPLSYDRWDKFRRAAQFLGEPRASLIVHAFGAFVVLLTAFIVTISAWTAKGCKNADDDPHADLGDDFKDGLKDWCTTKKASAVFDWLAFGAWLGLFVIAGLEFRRERRADRGFVPPADTGISYANVHDHINGTDNADPYADKQEYIPPAGSATGYESYGYSRTPGREEDEVAFGRPSVDPYGAFDQVDTATSLGSRPGEGHSRTMQHAYTDPCESS